MKKVTMVEYQGRCDASDKAVGHAPKVLTEYYRFIEQTADVGIFAPKVILQELPADLKQKAKVLPEKIVMKGHNSFLEKIANKQHMFRNLDLAIKNSDADILWLFNVEYYVMLYLFLHKKPRQKLVCTLFMENFGAGGLTGSVKKKIFACARKKMDLIISAGEKFSFPGCRSIFLPDYYYRPEKYDAYRKLPKREQAVCLGTMGDGKQLEELVETFNRLQYPLTIAGRFYDKERLKRLKEQAKENITIEDRYLTEAEYLELLAGSKFTVLPYAPAQYCQQTSGVLQEAVFVDTIPLTHQEILEGNEIPGVGFASWEDLEAEDLQQETEVFRASFDQLRKNRYDRDRIAKEYEKIFGE